MSKVQHFSANDMRFEAYGGPPGKAEIARLVGPEMSTSMGAGIATFDGCSIEWTVLYDELIVVLEGTFRLRIGGEDKRTIEAKPGDVIWLPENTPLHYEGDKAKVFYALTSGRLEVPPQSVRSHDYLSAPLFTAQSGRDGSPQPHPVDRARHGDGP